jgi:hypothetical protein
MIVINDAVVVEKTFQFTVTSYSAMKTKKQILRINVSDYCYSTLAPSLIDTSDKYAECGEGCACYKANIAGSDNSNM